MKSEVRDNSALSRFELDADGHTAVAYYSLSPGIMTFTHTEVASEVMGRGIASRLVRGALNIARERGLKVVPRCSFVGAYIARHPEYMDLLA